MSAKQLAALKLSVQRNAGLNFCPQRNDSVQIAKTEQSPVQLEVLCICNRQLQDILCSSCGFCFVGRVRKKCQVHPNAILLMDSSCCPKCRTVHLIEIRSSNTPTKKPENDGVEEELTMLRQERLSVSSARSTEARVHLEDHKLLPKGADDWESDIFMQCEQDSITHSTEGQYMQDASCRKYGGKVLFGDENYCASQREHVERNQHETTVGIAPIHRQTGEKAPYDRQTVGIGSFDRQTVGVTPFDRQTRGVSPLNRQTVSMSPFNRQTVGGTPFDRQTRGISPLNRQTVSMSPFNRRAVGVSPLHRQTVDVAPFEQAASVAPIDRDMGIFQSHTGDEFHVHSAGSVGERFADVTANTSYNQDQVNSLAWQNQHKNVQKGVLEGRASPFGLQSAYTTAQKRVLEEWESEQSKMSDMYCGDRRF